MYSHVLAFATLVAMPQSAEISLVQLELPPSAECRQEIRAIDDQADADIRNVSELIESLQHELKEQPKDSDQGPLTADLQIRLDRAKRRRASILDKQHSDLNVIRARCDRLLEDERQAKVRSREASAI